MTCYYCGDTADVQVSIGIDGLTLEDVFLDVCGACAIDQPKSNETPVTLAPCVDDLAWEVPF